MLYNKGNSYIILKAVVLIALLLDCQFPWHPHLEPTYIVAHGYQYMHVYWFNS